ncbi:MAG: tRNA (adenosine(37)-N6)-threonylcarbamoyltransferase complex ATPase subunit type 1 TsaE [Candidatus Yonathbacteria bacterium]|nr:tRNA (adenosine(37)-N6)-threonylcarbamoyltransferase complex ATPase subunit type 1 TsaE [Candidatus Yonathbacteria bacterium]
MEVTIGRKKTIKNLEEMRVFAEDFLRKLSAEPRKDHATVVGLSGNLGAGKTAFVKSVASVLSITDVITSPTFVLKKIYAIPQESIFGKSFSKLVHIDAYRLESGDEMSPLGWDCVCADSANLVLLEWPEQVASAMPKDMITISFEYVDEGVRKVNYKF